MQLIGGALLTLLGAVGGQLLRYMIEQRREKRRDVNDWYNEVLSIISRGLVICQRAQKRSSLNYGNISADSRKVSQDLRAHLNPYPEEIDEVTIGYVRTLEQYFQKISIATEATEDQSGSEAAEELFEIGQREYKKHEDLDLGNVLDASTEYSSIMESMINKTDKTAQDFGSQVQGPLKDAESIQQLLEEVNLQSAEGNLVEKRVDQQLPDEWDEGLSIATKIALQITTDACINGINHISKVNDMETADGLDRTESDESK